MNGETYVSTCAGEQHTTNQHDWQPKGRRRFSPLGMIRIIPDYGKFSFVAVAALILIWFYSQSTRGYPAPKNLRIYSRETDLQKIGADAAGAQGSDMHGNTADRPDAHVVRAAGGTARDDGSGSGKADATEVASGTATLNSGRVSVDSGDVSNVAGTNTIARRGAPPSKGSKNAYARDAALGDGGVDTQDGIGAGSKDVGGSDVAHGDAGISSRTSEDTGGSISADSSGSSEPPESDISGSSSTRTSKKADVLNMSAAGGVASHKIPTSAISGNVIKTITQMGNVGLKQESQQRVEPETADSASDHVRLPRSDEVFYTVAQPGTRMCWDPKHGMLAAPQTRGAKLDESLAILTAISADMSQFVTYNNYLFSVRRQGFEHVMQLPLLPLDRGLPEEVFWERRVESYVQYLAKLPEKLTLIIMDNLDMLVLASPADILESFQALKADIVFGAEMLCDTDACRSHLGLRKFMEVKAGKNKVKFLNAGNVIGRAGALHSLFKDVLKTMRELKVDDQAGIVQVWFKNPEVLTLDYETRIFGVVPQTCNQFLQAWTIEQLKDSNGFALRNRQSKFVPAIVHFAGMRLADGGWYRNPDFKLNPCQAFAASIYDKIGESLRPNLDYFTVKRPRIAVSLTTTPTRLQLLRSTLESLLQQDMPPTVVYLNIPRYSKRFGKAYEVPSWMKDLDVIVNWCEDVGPATKLLPTLALEEDPDTLLITADDDMVYKPTMFTDLVRHMLGWPHAAYNYAGQMADETGDRALYGRNAAVRSCDLDSYSLQPFAVDILEAFLGVIYRRDFFDDSIHDILDECWSTDDIHISQHLAKKGIPRIKLPQTPEDRAVPSEADTVTPLRSGNVFGDRANDRCAATHLLTFKTMWLSKPQPCPIRFQPMNVTSKGASNMIYTLDKSVSFDSDRGVCAMNRPSIDFRARVLFQGQYMTMSSMLITPGKKFGVSISKFGKVCLHKSNARQFFRCIKAVDGSGVRDGMFFFIFQTDGNLCLYDGHSPNNNHGLEWCWSDAMSDCRLGGCVMEICDDLILRIWTGTKSITVPWNRVLDQEISSALKSDRCQYSHQLSGFLPIEQPLEKSWSLTSQYYLASKVHSTIAFMDISGNLCSGRLLQGGHSSLQICACYPNKLEDTHTAPRVKEAANKLIVFNPDGNLCAYGGREQMATWEAHSERTLWCRQFPECAAQPCMLEVDVSGAMVMKTVSGNIAPLVTEGTCATDPEDQTRG